MTTVEEIGHFSDVPLEVLVELDRKIMTLRAILALDKGSVIKMNRSAGENLDVVVSGALLAFGEIVIIESSMGVRITDFNIEE
ncbi:MAG: FliM/FliN family flagellar motor switch protein [Acidobacteria bacterium]|nr:FliM/FliN family flagellar motor switch protein [Acidobacteriota bacterium]